MARRLTVFGLLIASLAPAAALQAQPVDIPLPAATTTEFPAGITVAKAPGGGQIYVDAQGRTLYGMDMRMVTRWSVDTSKYCKDRCDGWEPVLAPPGSTPNLVLRGGLGGPAAAVPPGSYTQGAAPDWTIVNGPAGPQYVYKGWHMVYVRKGDKPRQITFEGADDKIWNTLKFVPPVPKLTAPSGVGATFVAGAYVLSHKDGALLYTGRCSRDCAGWKPLAAAAASQGLGEWTVDRTADRPQWLYRGKPVFVATDDQLASLPRSTAVLRP